jgi:hypothetical protein
LSGGAGGPPPPTTTKGLYTVFDVSIIPRRTLTGHSLAARRFQHPFG